MSRSDDRDDLDDTSGLAWELLTPFERSDEMHGRSCVDPGGCGNLRCQHCGSPSLYQPIRQADPELEFRDRVAADMRRALQGRSRT